MALGCSEEARIGSRLVKSRHSFGRGGCHASDSLARWIVASQAVVEFELVGRRPIGHRNREVRACNVKERMQAPSAAMSDMPRRSRAVSRTRCDDDQEFGRSPSRGGKTATPDSVERPASLWLSESLHTFWRKAVRTPWRNARRSMRRALAAGSDAGAPVSVDTTTELAVVPFAGRFPPPLTQCEVLAPCQYRTRLHPLSVNSTKDECVHYVDHTVDAPAMMLEHLTDQYWFPYFGLLVSQQGQVWRHSYLGPFQDGFLTRVKAIVDRPLPDGSKEHLLYQDRLARIPRIAGEYLLLAGSDQPNYGHYLLDVVPLIHLGVKMGMPMLTWTLRPWQRALVARLDVPPGLIREIKPEPVFLEHAITSNRHCGRGFDQRAPADQGGLFRHPGEHRETCADSPSGRAGSWSAAASATPATSATERR